MNSIPESIESDENFSHSELNLTSTRRICWNVQNFKSLPKNAGFSLDSPSFIFKNATWCLRLYPNYDAIGCTIVRLRSSVPHHRLHYSLMVSDIKYSLNCRVADFDKDNDENGERKLFSRSYAHENSASLKSSSILKLACVISCYGLPVVDSFSQTKLVVQDAKDIVDLCQNYKNLLLNGQDHDLVLKAKGKEFLAHKSILRARSPVLDSMLSHNMVEKNSGVVDLPDCDPGAFEQFLLYLYSGEMETLDAGNMLALYYIADKYDIRYLKDKCRQFIKNAITCINVSDVIQLALNHCDADLLECATEYFVKHFSAVLRTAEWQSFSKCNNAQANELLIKAADMWDAENLRKAVRKITSKTSDYGESSAKCH